MDSFEILGTGETQAVQLGWLLEEIVRGNVHRILMDLIFENTPEEINKNPFKKQDK